MGAKSENSGWTQEQLEDLPEYCFAYAYLDILFEADKTMPGKLHPDTNIALDFLSQFTDMAEGEPTDWIVPVYNPDRAEPDQPSLGKLRLSKVYDYARGAYVCLAKELERLQLVKGEGMELLYACRTKAHLFDARAKSVKRPCIQLPPFIVRR